MQKMERSEDGVGSILRSGIRFESAQELDEFLAGNPRSKRVKRSRSKSKMGTPATATNVHPTTSTDSTTSRTDKRDCVSNVSNGSSTVEIGSKGDDRILSSQFRMINESMYRQTGSESFSMFHQDDKDDKSGTKHKNAIFEAYHTGFSRQLSKWPSDPMDNVVKCISRSHSKFKAETEKNDNVDRRKFVIVDMGCGLCRLRTRIRSCKSEFGDDVEVRCVDLVAAVDGVIECDMSRKIEAIDDESADIVVYSMSLMGTDVNECLLEGQRCLRLGGTLIIVEPESRFGGETTVKSFKAIVSKMGFQLKRVDNTTDSDSKERIRTGGGGSGSSNYFIQFEFQKTARLTNRDGILPPANRYSSSRTLATGVDVAVIDLRKMAHLNKIRLKPCTYKKR